MSYEAPEKRSIVIGMLDANDRSRELMANRIGLHARPMELDQDPSLADAGITLMLVKNDAEVIEKLTVSWALWNEIVAEGLYTEMHSEVGEGTSLEMALETAVNLAENLYVHDKCGTEWTDEHNCGVDDECPSCGHDISPVRTDYIRSAEEDGAGVWRLMKANGLGEKLEPSASRGLSP